MRVFFFDNTALETFELSLSAVIILFLKYFQLNDVQTTPLRFTVFCLLNYTRLLQGRRDGGQEGQLAPGPRGLRGLVIDDF